jgi:hypothetical protein
MTTEPITLSNTIRLTPRQWLGVALFALSFALLASPLWKLVEPFPFEPDYRIPREQKQDYWLYQRFSHLAASEVDGFVVGDSVVWGFFSKRNETLSHYLNRQAQEERLANFGMIGAHPLALEGLIRHYAVGITGKNVLLQCNLLWMKSPEEDLQIRDPDKTVASINHVGLIPQFTPRVPAYNQDVTRRLSILVDQRLSINQLAGHFQQSYYQQQTIPAWTKEHPYDDPLSPLLQGLPPSDNLLEKPQRPWFAGPRVKIARPLLAASTLALLGSPQQRSGPFSVVSAMIGMDQVTLIPEGSVAAPWVDMDTSLQWAAFQRAVKLLESRDNRVFVVVGPFNEHMLTRESKMRCQEVKATITAWLRASEVPHMIAEVLPTEEYADLSHPLPAGYERLAERLWSDAQFQAMMKGMR